MPRKLRELRADLRAGGFRIDHQTGSHQVWRHVNNPQITVNLAGNDGKDAKIYQKTEVRDALLRVREHDGGELR
jgi:predicted RNA binding protein YcfA (HicA-like mRNA interferase family)